MLNKCENTPNASSSTSATCYQEQLLQDLEVSPSGEKLDYVGRSHKIDLGWQKATGEAVYLDDMEFHNLLHGRILRSNIAHGKIKSIDTSEAEKMPGVHAVVTYKNTSQVVFNGLVRSIDDDWPATEQIFSATIRQYGQPIAAVAADTVRQADEALKAITVDYEQLEPILDLEDAYSNRIKLYPEGNRLPETLKETGDLEQVFSQADNIIESKLDTPMIHHLSMETHVCVAHWDNEDKLTVWCPHQGVFGAQIVLSKIFQKPYADIRVIRTLMGGAFGVKVGIIAEPICAELSRLTKRPVKIRFDRKESMIGSWTRHSARLYLRAAIKDGRITGLDISEYLNSGPHCGGTHFIPVAQAGKLFKLYKFDAMRFHGMPVLTNTPLQGAMRGFGSPQLFTAIELLIDKIARELNEDPVQIREQYLFKPYDENPLSPEDVMGNCRSIDCLLEGAEAFSWQDELPVEGGYLYGKGVGVGLHGNGVAPHAPDLTGMTLYLHEDGSYVLSTGICDHGGGSYMLLAQIVGEILKVKPESIRIKKPDTENTPYDLGAYGSRNTWVGGNCAVKVANKMKDKLLQHAAWYFDTTPDQIEITHGSFTNSIDSETVSIRKLLNKVLYEKKERLIVSEYFSSQQNAGSYGAHFALVRIEKASGKVEVVRYLAAADVGKAINPKLVEGQLEGGIQMGLGYALSEEILLDEQGVPTNANLKRYHVFTADEMPKAIELKLIEKYEDYGPFGAKSIGEAATVPVASAIVNAISNALGGEVFEKIPIHKEEILERINKR